MLVVNLYGAPGAGKSTGAAYIFSMLKMVGVNAELVTEFAKDKVWEENKAVFENQAYIFGKQYFRFTRLEDKVDVVVTDSPILLSAFYCGNNTLKECGLIDFVRRVAETQNSVNIFLERDKPFSPSGRFQKTAEESDQVSGEIKDFLAENGVDVIRCKGNLEGYKSIVTMVLGILMKEEQNGDR